MQWLPAIALNPSPIKSPMNSPSTSAPEPRRGFLARLASIVLGALALAVPAGSALAAFLNPWRQGSATEKLVRVTSLSTLPLGGPVGAVFLCRVGEQEVVAWQTICPHNGGCVSYDPQKKSFYCPSHGATFDANGRRLADKNVSPRDLDSLEVEIRGGGEVWVKFEKFQDGIPQKIVKAS
jgi:nitrite reductase/ring-hydroxylating ferredoxin subunit